MCLEVIHNIDQPYYYLNMSWITHCGIGIFVSYSAA